MDNVLIVPSENIGKNFIPAEYLPKGKDEYYQRNKQSIPPKSGWRNLRSDEVERLVKNVNTADNWDDILVTDQFDTNQIKNTRFFGLVRIGCIRNVILQHHDLRVPSGITNSLIISSDMVMMLLFIMCITLLIILLVIVASYLIFRKCIQQIMLNSAMVL
jgi:hypothetical protein